MWCNAEYFAGYEQQDAHEFLIAALASIYAGLALPENPTRPPTPADLVKMRGPSSAQRPLGAVDLQGIFTGVLRSDVACLKCHGKSTKYEEFQDISLDLSRLAAEEGGGATGYHTTLSGCLRSFTRAERLSSAERCWCPSCGALQDSTKQLSVHRLPNVLCFHLKRFKHSANKQQPPSKIESFVEFPLHSLNMRPHTSSYICSHNTHSNGQQQAPALEPLPEHLYDLFGVVVHHGTMQTGHYTNYVRCQADWFHCSDATVTPASVEEVRSAMGYLLFFQRKRCV